MQGSKVRTLLYTPVPRYPSWPGTFCLAVLRLWDFWAA